MRDYDVLHRSTTLSSPYTAFRYSLDGVIKHTNIESILAPPRSTHPFSRALAFSADCKSNKSIKRKA